MARYSYIHMVWLNVDCAEKDHDQYREDARELMRHIQEKCVEYDPERKVFICISIFLCSSSMFTISSSRSLSNISQVKCHRQSIGSSLSTAPTRSLSASGPSGV